MMTTLRRVLLGVLAGFVGIGFGFYGHATGWMLFVVSAYAVLITLRDAGADRRRVRPDRSDAGQRIPLLYRNAWPRNPTQEGRTGKGWFTFDVGANEGGCGGGDCD